MGGGRIIDMCYACPGFEAFQVFEDQITDLVENLPAQRRPVYQVPKKQI